MKAIVVTAFGALDKLQLAEVAIPEILPNQVLVRVEATSINPIDIKTRIGQGAANHFEVKPPFILGWDLSGQVVGCGSDVTEFMLGDHVFGCVGFPGLGQTHAEYVAVFASHLAHKPESISHLVCAAASMTGLTAWQALTRNAQLQQGDKVLIYGASGGVGYMAVQIAVSLGAEVVGVSSMMKMNTVLAAGAHHCLGYENTDGSLYPHDFDFILDCVGGENTLHLLKYLKRGGTLVSLLPHQFDIGSIARQQDKNFYFVLMQSNYLDMQQIATLLARHIILPKLSEIYCFSDFQQAYSLLESHQAFGKVVLIPNDQETL
ncbi:NADP-dependent oxidoreductase [Celerinatantimonas sp. YJH-8]|uniref:NADP-dependent oxidoreductase n=1 Tax=Celerinatantimonas sp. YJH-8 TaxID=3228714 RepID=UPI0038C8D672